MFLQSDPKSTAISRDSSNPRHLIMSRNTMQSCERKYYYWDLDRFK